MSDTSHYDAQIAKMTFASVYPHFVVEVELTRQVRYLDKLVDELTKGRITVRTLHTS